MRETYVMRNGELVPKRLAGPKHEKTDARVHVISDSMEPLKHMATGRIHDSKSRFRADTRAAGCIEGGNDAALLRPPQRYEPNTLDIVNDVKRSIAELQSR